MFLFHNQECIIDATRPRNEDFEYHVSTVEGKQLGWFTDDQVAHGQEKEVFTGFKLVNGSLFPTFQHAAQFVWFEFWGKQCVITDYKLDSDERYVYFLLDSQGKSVGWISDWLLKLECPELPLCINHF